MSYIFNFNNSSKIWFILILYHFFNHSEALTEEQDESKQLQQQTLVKNHRQLSTEANYTFQPYPGANSANFSSTTSQPTIFKGNHEPIIQARNWRDDNDRVEPNDYRIPFWNIAHMINSIEHIEPALRDGANGIETDISFDKQGIPAESYHGFPCDCGRHCHYRENFVAFIKHIAQITSPPFSSPLLLVVLDLKLKGLNDIQKETAGRHLAMILDEHLYRTYLKERQRHGDFEGQPGVRVIISINRVIDAILVRSFIEHVRDKRLDFVRQQVGFDVGMNDGLNEINAMWDNFNGAAVNIWQGDGLTNCANIIRGVDRLKKAIEIRNGQGHFKKVYYWTADVMYHIRSVLRLGLDAILTNQPQRVKEVLEENEFKGKYRLATAYDDPFAQFWIKPTAWKMSPPSLGETVETLSNIQKTSARFVKDLPDGIAVALQKVQESIVAVIK